MLTTDWQEKFTLYERCFARHHRHRSVHVIRIVTPSLICPGKIGSKSLFW